VFSRWNYQVSFLAASNALEKLICVSVRLWSFDFEHLAVFQAHAEGVTCMVQSRCHHLHELLSLDFGRLRMRALLPAERK
jgi:hypothetical protein